MTYFGPDQVLPVPNADDAPYWENCAQRRLTFQRCLQCRTFTHPPIGVCPQCQSTAREWIEAPELATVFSCTWIHTAAHDSVRERLPYNVVVVTFEGVPGVRLVSNVVDVTPGKLAIGDRVLLLWESVGELGLPRFRAVM